MSCREDLTPSSGLVVASPTPSIPPPSYPPQLSKPFPAPATARPHATPLAHARCLSLRHSSSPRTTPLRAASPHDGFLLSRGTDKDYKDGGVIILNDAIKGHIKNIMNHFKSDLLRFQAMFAYLMEDTFVLLLGDLSQHEPWI